eukprot:Skav204959  [mRNA]  locus=scaffold3104:540912:544409:+ [translate_table: standard]
MVTVQAKAKSTCEAMMTAEGDASNTHTLETCMFDYCFAGKDFAAEDAIAEANFYIRVAFGASSTTEDMYAEAS